MLGRRAFVTVVCWLAASFLSLNPVSAAPAITLSAAVGPPTTAISVSGTGFGASAAIDIYFDLAHLCLALASDTGTFSCTINAPKDAQPQTHWISAVQRNTGTGAQKSFIVRTDWQQFHGQNARHTGFNQYENTINTANVANLDTLWQAPIGPSGTWSTPVVANGRVYVPGLDGKLYAYFYKTGTIIPGFPKTLGGVVQESSAIVGGGNVYVGTVALDNKLYAFHTVTGAAIAGFPVSVGNSIVGSPAYYAGKVYVACTDGKVYAFNATNGATITGFPVTVGAGAALFSSVSAANDRIFIGSTDNFFYAFDATTGALIAGYPRNMSASIIRGAPVVVAGQVLFNASSGLWALRARDGRPMAGFPTSGIPENSSSPAVGNGQIVGKFVVSTSWNVSSYSATGTPQWTTTIIDSQERGSPVIANGIVYVPARDGVYALNAANGAILWRVAVSQSRQSSPVVADGILYVGSDDGNLYAYSVHGVAPASRLPGGELGVKPALSSLKPNLALKPARN